MKTTYIVTILALIAITVAGLVIFNDKQPVEPVVDDNISTTTVSTVPSPLTLASLQALPGWNPTMEVQGMKRVEDNNSELEVKGYTVYTEEMKWRDGDIPTFIIKYLEPEVSTDACEKYGLSTPHPYYGEYNCLIATPDLFNEVIIISKDTGEVLHKYRLEEGYSFLNSKYASEGPIMIVNPVHNRPYLMVVYMSKWGDIKDRNNLEFSHYYVDLLTGKIQKGKEYESAPTSI